MLWVSRILINDNKDGTLREYYDTGELKQEWTFKGGIFEGVSKSFYTTGEVMSEENYLKGKKEGVGMFYYKNGQVAHEDKYTDGVRVSRQSYDENGQPAGPGDEK